nr:MAG TPA: hypothetical protein [Caudoviricetes sp.]
MPLVRSEERFSRNANYSYGAYHRIIWRKHA